MSTEKKPLFELTPLELDDELSCMFTPFNDSHPIRCEVGAALMAAHVATQRLALRSLDESLAGVGADTHAALATLFE
ncbi:hypothetical protein [Paraburkholderia solisilvae]|uniref:Uncharacterized protein n=1 Tax=Paraburkholderia solisilvae TaxID=624376 RepID=A0A6J5EZL1_9BURK|nr:hypothetical protein [Paraburkholderia solisilvae]CAB3770456.1 hypothetical protein LMG29739_05787 [Paraburkholderia solisilvae]